jgi:enediyne biosynthesis protein E7
MRTKLAQSVPATLPSPSHPRRRPPGPLGLRLIGSLREIRRDRLAFVKNAVATYGPLVAFQLGRRAMYLVSNPHDARHVLSRNADNYQKGLGIEHANPLLGVGLLSSEDADWLEQRSLLQEAFHPRYLERFADVVLLEAQSALERWSSHGASELTYDLSMEMAQLTINVVAKALFGTGLGRSAIQLVKDLQIVGDWAMRRVDALLPLPSLALSFTNFPTYNALRRINLIARTIAQQIEKNETDDLHGFSAILRSIRHAGLSDKEADCRIRDQIVTFILAGYETTAATVSWAWYLLCNHPEVAKRVREELHTELGDRPPRYQDLARLTYTRMVVDETMRLYPPVWMITRRAITSDVLSGYTIPAGADVLVSIYSLHRRSEFWSEPETFDPQRFCKFIKKPGHSPYWPFGIGRRSCIANSFGVIGAMMIIGYLAPRANFTLISQSVEAEPGLTLRPRGGLMTCIECRNHSASGK